MPNSSPRRVEIFAYPNAQLLDVTGPAQVFATANELTRANGPPYEIAIVAEQEEVVTCSQVTLKAQFLPETNAPLDTLIIAGGSGVNAACERTPLIDWVDGRVKSARRTASVCSGAFLLAEAGLLDGRRAVTQWRRCAEFAKRFPSVRLEPDPIFIQDGPIWTSAGITAGIDLVLALVEADLGHGVALGVARQLVVYLKRPGGQAQFSAALALQQPDPRIERLHGWILDNLHRDLPLSALAEQAGMSERSFSRHYRRLTGQTPGRAVETLRVETARRQIEEGASLAQVCRRCGFGSDETMRRAFLRSLGISPRDYRDRFAI
jgi:transcriptional regulator GlxA family with amidase domain